MAAQQISISPDVWQQRACHRWAGSRGVVGTGRDCVDKASAIGLPLAGSSATAYTLADAGMVGQSAELVALKVLWQHVITDHALNGSPLPDRWVCDCVVSVLLKLDSRG
jgi:hypothetical protein